MRFKIRTAILLLLLLLLPAAGLAILGGANALISQVLEHEAADKAQLIVRTVSGLLSRQVIDGEKLSAGRELERLAAENPDILYAYLVDFDGRLFAHGFPQGFPRELWPPAEAVKNPPARAGKIACYRLGERPVCEISHPLIAGMSARLYLGFDQSGVAAAQQALFRRVAGITLLILGLSLALGWLLARRLSRPLEDFSRQLAAHEGGSPLARVAIPPGCPAEVAVMISNVNELAAEQGRLEKALRERERALKEAEEAGQVGLYIYDIQADTWTSSATMDRIFGIDADFPRTAAGWEELIHPAQRQEMRNYLAMIIREHQPFRRPYRIIRPADGAERWVLGLGEVEYDDDDGHPLFMVGTIQDITQQRQLEEQFRQAQKMESVGTLAGGIAHDFNNLLTAIIGYGQITLMEMGPDDPHRQNITDILAAANRGAHLTKSLLLFSRKQSSDRRPVNLNEVIGGVETLLRRMIGEDISLRTDLPPEPVPLLADAHQLEQVLMNLAANARDAMPKGGSLQLSVGRTELGDDFVAAHGYGRPGCYALLTVSDTGQGMSEETRQRLFEPFFSTKEVGKGTGLGLAVVYGIIKQHEGYITVESSPGAGTVFRIYLPLLRAEC